jgi:hypothetical protein
MNNQSILDSVKKVLQIPASLDVFDIDIIMHINSVFATLSQLGIGPVNGFFIEDKTKLWSDYLGDGPTADLRLNAVKTYMCLKVRMIFDPPTTSFTQTAYKEQIAELEWRINVQREETKWNMERLAQLPLLEL